MSGIERGRRILAGLLPALMILAVPAAAAARPVTDCPLRDAPFSLDAPLLDLLLSPVARAMANEALGGRLDHLPPMLAGTHPPTFAAILTLNEAARMTGGDPAALAALDRRLRTLPVTAADRVARCARYDDERPQLRLEKGKPRLLLFEKINGFKDVPGFDAAHAAILALAKKNGWAVTVTDKGGAFTPSILRRFDAVVWNNISGDVLTLSQRRAFRSYIEGGGSYIGVHGSAGDPNYFWDWYADTLIGARFAGHPMAPQFQDARIVLDDKSHPVARGLPAEWRMNDEWYSFRNNPRATGSRVIATLDESSYKQRGPFGQNLTMGDHPLAWTRKIGRGRMFYSAIGHRPETYSDPRYRTMLENALAWTIAERRGDKRDR